MHWILATFLLCLSCASRRIAKELGVHVRPGYRWCWWLRNAALSYSSSREFESKKLCSDKRSNGPCTLVNFCSSFFLETPLCGPSTPLS